MPFTFNHRLSLGAAAALILVTTPAHAWPLKPPPRAGAEKVPVACVRMELTFGDPAAELDCFRTDTRASVLPTPDGYHIAITDIRAYGVPVNQGATYFVEIGPFAGSFFTASTFFSGRSNEAEAINPSSPLVVTRGGETLAAQFTGILNDAGSSVTGVTVLVSGFLVSRDDLAEAF